MKVTEKSSYLGLYHCARFGKISEKQSFPLNELLNFVGLEFRNLTMLSKRISIIDVREIIFHVYKIFSGNILLLQQT